MQSRLATTQHQTTRPQRDQSRHKILHVWHLEASHEYKQPEQTVTLKRQVVLSGSACRAHSFKIEPSLLCYGPYPHPSRPYSWASCKCVPGGIVQWAWLKGRATWATQEIAEEDGGGECPKSSEDNPSLRPVEHPCHLRSRWRAKED